MEQMATWVGMAGLGWGIALGLAVALTIVLWPQAQQERPPAKDARANLPSVVSGGRQQ